jgi:hypothetical protein
LPGVYAAGDIVRGASLVVWAIREGRDAADAMHAYCSASEGGCGMSGANEIARYERERAKLERDGLYRAEDERDACGVGLVVAIDGKPRRDVVTLAIAALKAVWHRGAVDADGKTGDGAGILIEAPQDFFREIVVRTGHTPKDGPIFVGQIFLPRLDLGAQERARVIVESEIIRAGFVLYGWRQVPVNISQIGEKANATRPEIEQVLLYDPQGAIRKRSIAISSSAAAASKSARWPRTLPSFTSARCRRRRLDLQGHVPRRADR